MNKVFAAVSMSNTIGRTKSTFAARPLGLNKGTGKPAVPNLAYPDQTASGVVSRVWTGISFFINHITFSLSPLSSPVQDDRDCEKIEDLLAFFNLCIVMTKVILHHHSSIAPSFFPLHDDCHTLDLRRDDCERIEDVPAFFPFTLRSLLFAQLSSR
jgi:hypothetical protein